MEFLTGVDENGGDVSRQILKGFDIDYGVGPLNLGIGQ